MIIGHQKQRQFLKNSFQLGRLSHAYLFCGPANIGKKKIAVEFVKFLNCESLSTKPCDNCVSCKNIEKGIYSDFILLDQKYIDNNADKDKPKRKTKEIGIDMMRNLEYCSNLSPSVSFIKSIVIDNVHLMTSEAQNCFLKTLEEPKGVTLFILITEHPEMILSTILSRVQKIKFFLPEEKEIENYLKKQNISDAKIKDIINLCSRKPGLAINFLEDAKRLEYIKEKINEFNKIRNSNLNDKFEYAKQMSDYSNKKINEILDIWLSQTRKILLQKNQTINQNQCDKNDSSCVDSFKQLEKNVENIFNTRFLLSSTNISARLALENLMLDL
ncbi:MAG: hypothetical protein U9Q27_02540 [Patescibacteria group bacterium]|nr:hypothetical protein [Patescibacteria group bacterium]